MIKKLNTLPIQVDPALLDQIRRNGIKAIAEFAASFTEAATNQFLYDLGENIPRGILKVEDVALAAHAIPSGVASAVNSFGSWGYENAVRFASEILEDANCHTVNKILLDAAKADGISPYQGQ